MLHIIAPVFHVKKHIFNVKKKLDAILSFKF